MRVGVRDRRADHQQPENDLQEGRMTTPAPSIDNTATTQILLKLGEMGTQLAVIHEQLKDLPDHEARIRLLENAVPGGLQGRLSALEAGRNKLAGMAGAVSLLSPGPGSRVGIYVQHRRNFLHPYAPRAHLLGVVPSITQSR